MYTKYRKNFPNHHLASIDPELEQPDPILSQKLRIRLRVRLRAETPAINKNKTLTKNYSKSETLTEQKISES